MQITSPYAWHKADSSKAREAQNIERSFLMYLPAIKKVWKRVLAFSAVNLSLVARALTWNVYIITIIPYIAMRLAVTQDVANALCNAIRMHMKCSWWIKVEVLAGITECLRIKPCPVSPIAVGDSAFIAGTIRLDGVAWLTTTNGLTWSQRQASNALKHITNKLANHP
eukprot:1586680-Heterocapsa_arctica.AAC.1